MAVTSIAQFSISGFPASKLAWQNSSFIFPTVPQNISTSPSSSFSSSSWALKKLNHGFKVYSEGLNIPSEATVDSKFVPLNPEDPNYGPPALLLMGFQLEEADKIQQLLKDLEGDFLRVIFCTQDMISGTLWDALNTGQQRLDKIQIVKSVPRICFLSGLTGEEMMMFIEAFKESGMEPAVFAALVPNSAGKSLLELIDEIMSDHELTRIHKKDHELDSQDL